MIIFSLSKFEKAKCFGREKIGVKQIRNYNYVTLYKKSSNKIRSVKNGLTKKKCQISYV